MTDLPRWVWDLLADLLDEEDVHPKLYHQPGGANGPVPYDWCLAKPLAGVPKDVLDHAKAIAAYRAQVRWADAERMEATREPPADTERTEAAP